MKSLPLNNSAFILLLEEFKQYLTILGYAPQSIYYLPNHVQEFLYYMEEKNKNKIRHIDVEIIKDYLYYLQHRRNVRQGGGLSTGSILKQLQALNLLTGYLRKQYNLFIPVVSLNLGKEDNTPDVMSQSEIQDIYKAALTLSEKEQNHNTPLWLPEALYLRDKAMLGIFYGCGLRRNEGVQLDSADIYWSTNMLHVRKGKNYKERFVPIPKQVYHDLENYQYNSRPLFQKERKNAAFFISQKGNRINGQTLLVRLNKILECNGDLTLLQKKIGLHTLRHSIATHLLQNGMEIESISRFLGHGSLESTQLYTHLIEKENHDIQTLPVTERL
jgi:integrase/recombinase XerD